MKVHLLVVFFMFMSAIGLAQDPIYSQFYSAPNYLNPALNGQFEGDLRLNFIHRTQWTNIPGPLNYYSFSVDYSVPSFGGGFGLMVNRSSEGTAYLKKTSLSGIYSYSVSFENAVLSFGLIGGLINRKIDYDKLVFGDQLNKDGIIPGGETNASLPAFNSKFYFDAGAGLNLVLGNLMVGGAAQHLNKPDESFTGSKALLDMRYNGHLSYRWALDYYDEENSPLLIPSVLYYQHGQFRSVSAGMQYKFRRANVGVWFRGEGKQSDAIVISLLFDLFNRRDYYDKVRVGLSHDATTSNLNYGKTAGSTEGSITWETTFPGRNGGGEDRYHYGKRCYDFY
ncbi:PorP/SprF family type IX secretion system membrane protein [Pedobacter sp. SYSU D00535]|uniref:PorP/SprF family type IX secretion system membrane protein n=1 Tax=Pedobacter sp. SYSU D00535 TaxID=2810308 RepID=UPI001A957E98|nr:PorP/SprF family type IX secretion system membrane protein [Pedobacter sp. SYSU D00535]